MLRIRPSSLATTHCSDTTQCSHIDLPLEYWSSSQVFTLRSLDRHDLFVPRARTSMAQTRAFAIIGPSLWNQLLPSTRSTLLTGEPRQCLFSFSQDCSLLSGSLALEALLIGVHWRDHDGQVSVADEERWQRKAGE